MSGLNAKDKMSMYDMALTFAFGGAVFVVRFWLMDFVNGKLSRDRSTLNHISRVVFSSLFKNR